jgi:uncharacterized membrane protein/protein-disulfide isomerase
MIAASRAFCFIAAFAALALAISVYIHVHGKGPHASLPGCSGSDACDAVISSRWARWGPFPVSILGIGCYVSLISACAAVRWRPSGIHHLPAWSFMVILSLSGLAFIAWLFGLQWLVIRHFCLFCLSAHLFGAVAFALVIRYAPIWGSLDRARLKMALPSAGILAFLVGVHVLFNPDMTVVQAAEDFDESVVEHTGGSLRIGTRAKSREVSLLEGKLTFDLYKVPLVGSPEAEHVMVKLFDYPCPSCRQLDAKLTELLEQYPEQIAIVMLPVPMNSDCNPHVGRTFPAFRKSCTYVNLAMGVRQADRTLFGDYHTFLMTGGRVPSVGKAEAKAEELVGAEALARGRAAGEAKQWVQDGISLYQYLQAKSLPKLIVNDKVISYSGSARKKLFGTIREELGLEPIEDQPR